MKVTKQNVRAIVVVTALVFAAFLCRRAVVWVDFQPLDKLLNFTRTFIYIGLYSAWGISVGRHVMQTQARRFLVAVSVMMSSWFVLREIKYRFIQDDNLIRYFWYFYYIPLLTIPLLALVVSLSLGKPEDFRLSRRTYPLYAVTLMLIVLTLTNDLHQMVFKFPADASVWTEFNRRTGFAFYLIIAWGVFCTAASLCVMLRRSRIPRGGRVIWLPIVPFTAAVAYFTLSPLNFPPVKLYLSDFAAVCCLLFAGFFESCIQSGLIQSNSRYSALFSASVGTSVQITDSGYNVRFSSGSAEYLSKETMKSAEDKPVVLSGGKRLRNMPINGGRVVWTEDISELLRLHETLEDRQDELRERGALLQYEYDKEKRHRATEEQNRLYDLLQSKTQAQLDAINKLVLDYGNTRDADKKKQILSRVLVLGSYIKRSKDFVLSADSMIEIPVSMLESALRESFRALKFMNIKGGFLVNTERRLVSSEALILAYDFFEDALEASLNLAGYINVRVCEVKGKLRINILTDCKPDVEAVLKKYPTARLLTEDDGSSLVLLLEGGAV